MKYLQRALLHIGLCLLLVCSANGAFAQDDQVIGLTAPSTNNSIIRFTINVPSVIKTLGTMTFPHLEGQNLNEIRIISHLYAL